MLYSKPGIYKIINTITNKVYIGQSNSISRRWQNHKQALIKGTHYCEHLQRSFVKYGVDNFICEAIEYIDETDLNKLKVKLTEREYYWITEYQNQKIKLYNVIQCPTMSPLGLSQPITSQKVRGSGNGSAKLTEQQAITLLTTDSTLTYKEAVKKYGVSRACIKDLWQRRSWEHLNYPKIIHEDEPEYRSGENHPLSQLTEEQAIAILTTDSALTVNECCDKYKVNRIVIEQLRHRTTWKHLDYPVVSTKDLTKATGSSNGNSKLDDDKVRQIKLALEDGRSCCSIGKEFGVSNVSVANIRDGKIWKHVK